MIGAKSALIRHGPSVPVVQAHRRWGFVPVSQEAWAKAGLAFYCTGTVSYMRLGAKSMRNASGAKVLA
eukprot:5043972-Amphidinium_carterae.3